MIELESDRKLAADRFQWHGRPFRHMTDREIDTAIQERQEALSKTKPTTMAYELISQAIERLETERRRRLEWAMRYR